MKRRARHHDYKRPAKYMLTLNKAAAIPVLSVIAGNLKVTDPENEDFPHSVPLPAGKAVCKAVSEWLNRYPQIRVDRYVVMPDHVHLCVRVVADLEVGLSRAVSNFMGKCSRAYHDSTNGKDSSAEMASFFCKGFNDRIAYNDEQYRRQLDYVADNPRRLLMKREHPDLFFRRWIVSVGDDRFQALGNIFLLRNPMIAQVRFSRRYSEEFWEAELRKYDETIENGGVIVSPFIHPNEKAVRDQAVASGGNIIRICENGFDERFSPKGVELKLMESSRLLLIAPMSHDTRKQEMRYAKAQKLNAIAAGLAAQEPGRRFRLSME